MFDSLEIIKENSHEDASLRLQELIGKFIQDNEKFSLGLSGGSTPRFFYQNFAISILPATQGPAKEHSCIDLATSSSCNHRTVQLHSRYPWKSFSGSPPLQSFS